MKTVSARIASALEGEVSDVFGLMGNGNAYFLDAVEALAYTYTAVRHEAAAVAAADGYHRASGRVAIATVTYGAGFTNALTALAEASQARTPMVIVAGDAPRTGARPWDVDQIALATAVGAPTLTVGLDDAGAVARRALRMAIDERTPVVLAIPYDLAGAVAPEERLEPLEPALPRPTPSAAEIAEIAGILASAKRPILLAGRGAWFSGASTALGELADTLGAITMSSAAARGVFPRSEFDLGVAGGFGQDNAMAQVHEADVAVVIGAGMNQFTMRFGDLFAEGTVVVRIDLDAKPKDLSVTHVLQGDARTTVEALVAHLRATGVASTEWRERVAGFSDGSFRAVDGGVGVCEDGRLDPRSVAAALADILPAERTVVSDGGHFIGWANTHWPVSAPDRMLLVGTTYQSIGLGIPSAVGAAVAAPERTTVVTAGDGGALMAIADLESVIRVAKRAVIVIWNDAAYGAEVHMYGLWGLATGPMMIDQVDFAAVARGFGAKASVIERLDDFAFVTAWLATNEPGTYLLDCRISRSVMAPYQVEIVEAVERKAAASAK